VKPSTDIESRLALCCDLSSSGIENCVDGQVWQRANPVIQHELASVQRGVAYHAKRLR
jgi:hypothetical protein